MKRYFLFLLLLFTGLFTAAFAQVKGHSYYAFHTAMGSDEIPSTILLEVENDGMLALGMIKYEQAEEPIFIYGRRDPQDKNILHMEEHLMNGQWTGKLDLTLKDGAVKGGLWQTPQEDRSYKILVRERIPFPYDEVRTFFMPATKEDMKGHYVNYIRQGKAIQNDRALNVMPQGDNTCGFVSVEQSAKTLVMGVFETKGANELVCTNDFGGNHEAVNVKFFDNFAVVTVPEAGEGSEVALAEGFYIREPGVLEMTTWGPSADEIFSVRARLDYGVPSLIVSKKRYEREKDMYMEEPNLKSGRHPLINVQGPVIDMFISDVGQDINPYLWLLLEDHTVQMISLQYFRQTGVNLVSDPMPNIRDIQYFSNFDPNASSTETSKDDEDEEIDDGSYVYGIDSEGKAHDLEPSWDAGDYICHPENDPVVGDGYIGLGKYWEIHLIVKDKETEFSYFGQYWIIEDDPEKGYKVGYHMNRIRDNKKSDMEETPCDIEGSFYFKRGETSNWDDIMVTPIDGLEFTPKNKKVLYTRVQAVG